MSQTKQPTTSTTTSQPRGKDGSKESFVDEASQKSSQLMDYNMEDLWALVTGARWHATYKKDLFKDLHPSEVPSVRTVTGMALSVAGEGTVYIPELGDIKGVLFVPDMKFNILSCTKLCREKHFHAVFQSDGGCVTYNGKVVSNIIWLNGVSFLEPKAKMVVPNQNKSPEGEPDAPPESPMARKKGTEPVPLCLGLY